MISLLDLACMVHACVYLVLLLSLVWVFPGVTVIFNLALPFLDAMAWWFLLYLVELDFQRELKLSGVVLGLFTRPRNP